MHIVKDGIRNLGPYPVERIAELEKVQIGPWSYQMECEYPCMLEEGTKISARYLGDGVPNYKQFQFLVTDKEDTLIRNKFSGPRILSSVNIKKEKSDLSNHSISISIAITDLGNRVYRAPIEEEIFLSVADAMRQFFPEAPQKDYPKVPMRVYIFILFFFTLILGIVGVWSYYILRITNLRFKAEVD